VWIKKDDVLAHGVMEITDEGRERAALLVVTTATPFVSPQIPSIRVITGSDVICMR